ncbi:hypothetical protein CC80DRAFT_555249 [Byssothecium circinans]|uniref:Uncharacterized protein n=1 Tax=Byssothecium circinans TaxID=147558 RepID=A0A6A5TKM9_9PLEO|nr:hypothetical protein CC80DRAFT_555249 [Byssothecium circinans]
MPSAVNLGSATGPSVLELLNHQCTPLGRWNGQLANLCLGDWSQPEGELAISRYRSTALMHNTNTYAMYLRHRRATDHRPQTTDHMLENTRAPSPDTAASPIARAGHLSTALCLPVVRELLFVELNHRRPAVSPARDRLRTASDGFCLQIGARREPSPCKSQAIIKLEQALWAC